jgi:hypothetical protein
MTKIAKIFSSTFTMFTLSLGLAAAASAQGKSDDTFGTEVSSQCAQIADARLKDDCVRRLRSDAQLGSERSWQGGASGSNSSRGDGNGVGQGIGGPGKGRR